MKSTASVHLEFALLFTDRRWKGYNESRAAEFLQMADKLSLATPVHFDFVRTREQVCSRLHLYKRKREERDVTSE
jgi:hypothetical protein